ncbi:sensor histidine kinase [Puia sp. P3]|uniref:sensor histidine kinase n=1 Tax=Puia sp. P3 TaxID=3423952 RepID=UPI003D675CDC
MQNADCDTLLRHVLTDLGQVIAESKATISYDDLPMVSGYPTELKLLFQNLISNSLKFVKKDVLPEIKITAVQKDPFWQFCFEDNGIGIEEKDFERIFDIFRRLHPRSVYQGSGIGLAHCKKIVEIHGGTIWVESVAGKGSSFYFTIYAGSPGPTIGPID